MSDDFKRAALWAPFSPLMAGYHAVRGLVNSVVPEAGGGMYTGPLSTVAGINKTRWAKITDYAGTEPTVYGWEEQTLQKLEPGGNATIGFVKADAGITGTVNRDRFLNPIVEPNQKTMDVGDFVLVRPEYYDPDYDWVFVAVGGASGGAGKASGVQFAKCIGTAPVADGRYNARLQVVQADGKFLDTGASIWLRDANDTPALLNTEVYMCTRTGFTAGRPVYTTSDYDLIVRDQDGAQQQVQTYVLEYGPTAKVTITRPSARQTRVYIKGLTIYDIFSNQTFDDVQTLYFDSSYNDETDYDPAYGDFIFAWYDESQRILQVKLNGASKSRDFLTRCADGRLQKRTITCRNGLTKIISDEVLSGT